MVELDFTFERRLEFAEEEKKQAIKEAVAEAVENDTMDNIFLILKEYGTIPESLKEKIKAEKSIDALKQWLILAAKSKSIEEFMEKM